MNLDLPDAAILHECVSRWLAEDIGPCDITTVGLVDKNRMAEAEIIAKQAGVLSGLPVAGYIFESLDSSIKAKALRYDGEPFKKDEVLLKLKGPAQAILSGERTALNILQHLSGIATQTAKFVKAIAGSKTKILDTRKTVPGLRHFAKYAVRCGGGINHRIGLYDEFMIKDNHCALMPSKKKDLINAIRKAKEFRPDTKITVEIESLKSIPVLLEEKVDQILLDNMDNKIMTEAVRLVAGKCKLEASGNMTLERVPSVAATGVDYISVGALTHSVQAIDLSLEIKI
jgi:nicotinate-nucleotide pyrophosphorylase (carboxylating)